MNTSNLILDLRRSFFPRLKTAVLARWLKRMKIHGERHLLISMNVVASSQPGVWAVLFKVRGKESWNHTGGSRLLHRSGLVG